MPFTFSHIAAVLPLKSKFEKTFSMSGLIIGSMVPDFEYFLRYELLGHIGHTLKGIFIFDIPVSYALIIIFHYFVREQLILHLPNNFYKKFAKFEKINLVKFTNLISIKLFLSIIVGIFTHFLWDGFTHDEEYYLINFFPFLHNEIHLANLKMPLYSFLQYFSSVLGFIIIANFLYNYPKETTLNNNKINSYWMYFTIIFIFLMIIRYLVGVPSNKPFGQFIVIFCSSAMLSLLFVSTLFKIKFLK